MKKLARHKVTFEGFSDQNALVLAGIGIGNKEIARQTNLSSGQITYRLSKAKAVLGRDNGFRVDWRNGNSPHLGRIMEAYASIAVKEIERKIVPRLVHPTPKTVRIKE